MVSKHFLTAAFVGAAMLLVGPDANVFARGGGGGGGGHGGGGGGHGGGFGGGYGGGRGYGGGYGYGGRGYGGFGYGGLGYGYGGFGYGGLGYGYGGLGYGGGFYGDYNTGGGYPGYYAPYAYPAPSYYNYPDPGAYYGSPQGSSGGYSNPSTTYFYARPAAAVDNTAAIHVVLPDAQAKVLFDGRATTSTGSDRYFHTPDLAPGGSYKYNLRVSWMQDGTQVSQERTVDVTPGKTTEVVFSRTPNQSAPAISSVVNK